MTHHLNLNTITLARGSHPDRDQGVCFLEAAAWFAGEGHTDRPSCVSPVLAAFGRAWSAALPDDERQKLKVYIPRLVGTAGAAEADERRAWMATDWLVRVHTPAWLRLAGLTAQAERLEGLPELTAETTPSVLPVLTVVRSDADAAADIAWDAAWAAARDAWDAGDAGAARDAAGAAAAAAGAVRAVGAVRDAWAAAWAAAAAAAARAAAAEAAADAARAALKPTRDQLIASAHDLFDRMIEVRTEVPA